MRPVPFTCPTWCISCTTDPCAELGSHYSGDSRFGAVALGRSDLIAVNPTGTVSVTPGTVRIFLTGTSVSITLPQARALLASLPIALEALGDE